MSVPSTSELLVCNTQSEAPHTAITHCHDSHCAPHHPQLREDVTRFRYGDEQHLDEALNRIFIFGRQGGIARRLTPILTGIREEAVNGNYALVLEFSTKKVCLPASIV